MMDRHATAEIVWDWLRLPGALLSRAWESPGFPGFVAGCGVGMAGALVVVSCLGVLG